MLVIETIAALAGDPLAVGPLAVCPLAGPALPRRAPARRWRSA